MSFVEPILAILQGARTDINFPSDHRTHTIFQEALCHRTDRNFPGKCPRRTNISVIGLGGCFRIKPNKKFKRRMYVRGALTLYAKDNNI